jgi:hypothetical protein
MQYGTFDDEAKEYVIHRPDTPQLPGFRGVRRDHHQ